MKKILLMLVAAILCLSIFTGCAQKSNNKDDDGKKSSKNDGTVSEAEKALVVESFNSLDLASITESFANYTDLVKDLEFSANLKVSGTLDSEEGTLSLDAALKDNVASFKLTSSDSVDNEMIFQLGENSIDVFTKKDTWYKQEIPFYNSLDESFNAIGDMFSNINIPELQSSDLTPKDGMLLVSNSYIAKLVFELAPLFYGADELEGEVVLTVKDIKDFLVESKIKVYFGIGENGISRLLVNFDVEDVEGSADVVFTDDGKNLKNITLKWNRDYSVDNITYKPQSVIAFEYIFNQNGEVVGSHLNADIYIEETTFIAEEAFGWSDIYYKASIDTTVNLANIGKNNADILKLDFEYVVDKVINCNENGYTEGDKNNVADDLKISGTLKSETFNKMTLACEIEADYTTVRANGVLEYAASEDEFSFNGSFQTVNVDLDFNGTIVFDNVNKPVVPSEYVNTVPKTDYT